MANKKTHRGRRRTKNPTNSAMTEKYIGFEILNADCKKIGTVLAVVNYGAGDIIIGAAIADSSADSESEKPAKEFMVPMIPAAILNINEDKKSITINEEFAS